MNNGTNINNMTTYNTKSEVRQTVKEAIANDKNLRFNFDCGLKFYCRGETLIKEHEYRFIWTDYTDVEKFITAVWSKIKRGGEIVDA